MSRYFIINILLFLTFQLFYLQVFSQKLIVSARDKAGISISPIVLTISDLSDTLKIKEYFVSDNSTLNVELKKTYDNLFIRLSSYSYYDVTKVIKSPQKTSSYPVKFVLRQKPPIKIKEIVVKSDKPPYYKTKDTISYNVSSFLDGTEVKIQDVIEKLPGIDVNKQSGEIKYKGKSVETVTLDGDNLFGFNYMLGTKNINVDMISQVQAIDNYSENPLLKGIEQDGKVSLNLKLKKGKFDVSGSVDIGVGLFEGFSEALKIGSTILGITKSYKSFATLKYNNIGINNSPFDYFGFNFNIEQQKEDNYFADKIIPETRFANLLDDRRNNINKQLFGNYNSIFKIGKKLSIKVNLYYLQDKILSNQELENKFNINKTKFNIYDNTIITKKPQQYRGDLEIKYNSSKSSLTEYRLRIRQENIETPTLITQNKVTNFSSILNTEDFYLKQDLLFTQKLSDKKVLQISLLHALNTLPQIYTISPSLIDTTSITDTQESTFDKNYFEGKAVFLGSSKGDKYSFTIGAKYKNTLYKSELHNLKKHFSSNNFTYEKKSVFNTGGYSMKRRRLRISPSYSVNLQTQYLQDTVTKKTNNFIFEPSLNIEYYINSISFLSLNAGYNKNTNEESYFFLNPVLIDNRTSIKNTPDLSLQEEQTYSLQYFLNDLSHQFLFNINLIYQLSKGNFFNNSFITKTTTQINYFFLPQYTDNWNAGVEISKYIQFIESTLRIRCNYSISHFNNIVNNSQLRYNTGKMFRNTFFWKTAFDIPINFENTVLWQYSNSLSENSLSFSNNFIQNTFKIIIKPFKRWFLILSSDYFLPNIDKKDENFLFLDINLRHGFRKNKWNVSLTLKNITNEENFVEVRTSDISTSIFRSNLLPRYILFNISRSF